MTDEEYCETIQKVKEASLAALWEVEMAAAKLRVSLNALPGVVVQVHPPPKPHDDVVQEGPPSPAPPPCEIVIDVQVDPNDISKFIATAHCDGGVRNP